MLDSSAAEALDQISLSWITPGRIAGSRRTGVASVLKSRSVFIGGKA
jgi:hypothetical protein